MKIKIVTGAYSHEVEREFNSFMNDNKDIHIIKIINKIYNSSQSHIIYIYYYNDIELRSKKIQSLIKPKIEFDES